MKENELQSRSTEHTIQSTVMAREIDTSSLSRAMSQIGLKDTELIKLKQQIEELEKERVKEERGREKAEDKYQELAQQNDKLSQQVVDKLALQGSRHLIWDQIIMESDKFWPYLDIIEDHEIAMKEAKKQAQIVSTEVNKRPLVTANNSITFLSFMSDGSTSRYGIQNRSVVVSGAKNIVAKHRMMEMI